MRTAEARETLSEPSAYLPIAMHELHELDATASAPTAVDASVKEASASLFSTVVVGLGSGLGSLTARFSSDARAAQDEAAGEGDEERRQNLMA